MFAELNPEQATAFQPFEFNFTLRVAQAAESHPPFMPPARLPTIVFTDDDGNPTGEMGLNDSPRLRFQQAVQMRYKTDRVKYLSFMYRWLAIENVLESERFAARVQAAPHAAASIRQAVIDLGACLPLSEQGQLDEQTLFGQLP